MTPEDHLSLWIEGEIDRWLERARRAHQHRSPWFGPQQRPWEPGWYETGHGSGDPRRGVPVSVRRWWWDGKLWRTAPEGLVLQVQRRVWCGLARPGVVK